MNPKIYCEFALLILPLSLWGCAHSEKASVPLHKQMVDQQLAASVNLPAASSYRQMQGALDYYIALDDRPGQWRANYQLAQWALSQHQGTRALEYAKVAFELADKLNDGAMKSASAVLLGQLKDNDKDLFNFAFEQAATPLQKAIALSLLDRYDEVAELMDSIDGALYPNEKGFLLYRYGKQNHSIDHIEQALRYYQTAGNNKGVVDSLFLAAKIAENKLKALDYARRALASAEIQSDRQRITAIQLWLNQQGGT